MYGKGLLCDNGLYISSVPSSKLFISPVTHTLAGSETLNTCEHMEVWVHSKKAMNLINIVRVSRYAMVHFILVTLKATEYHGEYNG